MFGTLRLRPVTRDELFGPVSRQLDRMLNDVFGQDFTEGMKNKANFPPLDAYTTSAAFPDANPFDPGAASGLAGDPFNYIRNSVKVVMNAYDGTMSFYGMGATGGWGATLNRCIISWGAAWITAAS